MTTLPSRSPRNPLQYVCHPFASRLGPDQGHPATGEMLRYRNPGHPPELSFVGKVTVRGKEPAHLGVNAYANQVATCSLFGVFMCSNMGTDGHRIRKGSPTVEYIKASTTWSESDTTPLKQFTQTGADCVSHVDSFHNHEVIRCSSLLAGNRRRGCSRSLYVMSLSIFRLNAHIIQTSFSFLQRTVSKAPNTRMSERTPTTIRL